MRETLAQVRSLLSRLEGEPADAIESQTLECKPWDSDPSRYREQVRELREVTVCLANGGGGLILLGVHDRKQSRKQALVGVESLDVDRLRKALYDGTDPHILVDVEELIEPEGRILVLHVPRGLGPHTTTDGVAKVRVGKDCQPLTGSMLAGLLLRMGDMDRTAQPVPSARLDDLDMDRVRHLGRIMATEGRKPELGRLDPRSLLQSVGLVRDEEVSLAAILLVGRPAALARWVPQHEVVFVRYTKPTRYDVRHNLKGPIVQELDTLRDLLEAHLHVSTVETAGLAEITAPELSWWAAREAVLNALVHRDYFLHQSIYVELRPGRVDVVSPGGFVGGVTPENILRHPPARRNPLLADVLESAGFVNRAGMGVDRIYEELLRLGKEIPRYEADEASVRLILPTRTHAAFAAFVAEEMRGGHSLELDDLILLRVLVDCGDLDRWSAAASLQVGPDDAAEALASLRARGYLLPQGRGRSTTYRLTRALSDRLRGRLATNESLPLDDEAIRLRVAAVLRERGRITNAEVRRVSGYSRAEVVRLMHALEASGMARLRGRGRAAHYVAGPGLASSTVGEESTHRVQRRRTRSTK